MKTIRHQVKIFFKDSLRKRWARIAACAMLLAALWFWRALPDPLFDDPVSAVLEDRSGRLLGAVIAGDEQWRFPFNPEVPEKFRLAAVHFEDKRFFKQILAAYRGSIEVKTINDRAFSGPGVVFKAVQKQKERTAVAG